MDFSGTFLAQRDIDALAVPKNKLEPTYSDSYKAWRDNREDEAARDGLLRAVSPFIDKTVQSIPGADANYLKIRGKVLAMNAMGKYDPEQSSLETYLTHQLMPLRRTARQQMNVLGLPDRMLMASQQLDGAEVELTDELGRMPTTQELSDRMQISAKQIERIRRMAHARNTGTFLTPDEEGTVGGGSEVVGRLPDAYRHQYVMSALEKDPKSLLIYEHDQQLHGRPKLSTNELAEKLGLSPGAISQRRQRIGEVSNNAEREIYGA